MNSTVPFLLGFFLVQEAYSLPLRMDQPSAVCGKRALRKWNVDYKALPPAEKQWMDSWAHYEDTYDLTGDGVRDQLAITATPYVRGCVVEESLPWKEVHVTLTDGAEGTRKLWNFPGCMPERYRADLGAKRITLFGKCRTGELWKKDLPYAGKE